MTPRAILIAAKALIPDEAHWWRGGMSGGTDCAGSAIVKSGDGFNNLGLALFRKVIGRRSVPDWNDAPERTFAELQAAFDRAIELAGEASP